MEHRSLRTHSLAAMLCLSVVAGCSHTAQQVTTSPGPSADTPIVLPVQVHATAAGIAKASADSVDRPWTMADVDFVHGMISHHAQAIIMCRWAPTHGASQAVQTLCGRVINAQGDEIVLMQQWLADRRQPVPPPKPLPMHMVMDGMEHDMMMPGMLTEAQMAELDRARGADWDRLFLAGMIQHHRGAVSMVEQLWGTNGAAQDQWIFKFSNDVHVDQTTEIARMQKMLLNVPVTAQ